MKKFKIIFLTSIVLVLIFYSCNKSFPDGEPAYTPCFYIALVDEQTKKSLFDTVTGTKYHLDSVKLFNQAGKQINVGPVKYVNRNDTTYILDKQDGIWGWAIEFWPFPIEWNSFEEKYNPFDTTFYLYLNQYDTDTLIYHYYIDTIYDDVTGGFIKLEYLNYVQQQHKRKSEVILIPKK